MNGRLTGAAPSSPAERDAFSRAGKQPYSIKIGNRWFQYNQSTGPLALALAATAAFHDSFARTGNAPITERVSEAAGVIGNSIVDSSFFRGIENLMNAISDPKRFGERFAGDLAAGMVPLSGLQRNIANAVDPMVRQPDGMYERILSGLPLLSKKFLPNLTFWGASPCRRSAQEWPHSYQHASPRTNLAAQLMPKLNRLGVTPGFVGESVTIGNRKYTLDRDQRRELQIQTGKAIYSSLERLFNSRGYAGLTDEQRQQRAEQAVRTAHDQARERYVSQLAKRVRSGGETLQARRDKGRPAWNQQR